MFQQNWKHTIFSVWILNRIKINLFYFFSLSLSVSFDCFIYQASYNEIKNAKQPSSCQWFHCAFWIYKNECISSATTAEQKINRYAQKLGQFNSKSMRFYEFSIVISGILNWCTTIRSNIINLNSFLFFWTKISPFFEFLVSNCTFGSLKLNSMMYFNLNIHIISLTWQKEKKSNLFTFKL